MGQTDTTLDLLLTDARLCTLAGDDGYGLIEDGALGIRNGRLCHVGPLRLLDRAAQGGAARRVALGGALVTPGLIDCHTHLVFGGSRADEFEKRLEGASYEQIARAGGGIASSVHATRAASEDDLLRLALPRAADLVADGVTTLEIKSGYGLDLANELKMLRVARRIGSRLGLEVRTTLLAAHSVPPEYAGRADDYVEHICCEIIPAAAGARLADAVDAYCEGIGFSPAQTRRVFEAAQAHGLPVKLHADQLSDLGGAALLAAFGGLSADHIEYSSEAGIEAMATAGSTAVLLPGAFLCLRETKLPPIDALRRHRVPMAVATDLNPGTSPLRSLRLAMNLACIQFRLTPEEALRGATVNAARALGLTDRGRLAVGLRADLAVWDCETPAELSYWTGGRLLRQTLVAGKTCFDAGRG